MTCLSWKLLWTSRRAKVEVVTHKSPKNKKYNLRKKVTLLKKKAPLILSDKTVKRGTKKRPLSSMLIWKWVKLSVLKAEISPCRSTKFQKLKPLFSDIWSEIHTKSIRSAYGQMKLMPNGFREEQHTIKFHRPSWYGSKTRNLVLTWRRTCEFSDSSSGRYLNLLTLLVYNLQASTSAKMDGSVWAMLARTPRSWNGSLFTIAHFTKETTWMSSLRVCLKQNP